MKLTLKRTVDENFEPRLIFELDGKKYSPDHKLSRKLTNTTGESGYGIFTMSCDTCYFYKDNVIVPVEFTSPLNLKASLPEILAVIISRIKGVKEAFQAKKPVEDTISYDFQP